MNKVVHFEIPADEPERAHAFYKTVFGWAIHAIPSMGYAMVTTGPTNEHGMPTEPSFINGGMLKRQDPIKHPVIIINVESIDEAAKKIELNGGTMVRGKMPVGGMGYVAYCTDSEGNVLGLWENK